MKLELTDKDLFLLKLAFSVLIVFMTVRFLVMPQIEGIQAGKIQKEELTMNREEMEEAIASIPSTEKAIEKRLTDLSSASEDYYDVMENRQVDEILTGLAVKTGLFPVSLSIDEAQPGLPAAYLYSLTPEAVVPASENYVLTAKGTMVLRGSESNIFRFIDEIEKNYPAVQIRTMRISEQEYLDVDWNLVKKSEVNFTLAVYMCDRSVAE